MVFSGQEWGTCSSYALRILEGQLLGALGGTPNRDPCSLLGVIWVQPGYIGVYKAYIRVI